MSLSEQNTLFQIGATLRSIGKLVRKQFIAENLVITPEQYGLLHVISQKDEFIQSELATFFDKDKSAILRHVDVLEKNKLVVRLADEADRRKKFLVLTKKGNDVLQKGTEIIQMIQASVEVGIAEKDMVIFKSVLAKMKENAIAQ